MTILKGDRFQSGRAIVPALAPSDCCLQDSSVCSGQLAGVAWSDHILAAAPLVKFITCDLLCSSFLANASQRFRYRIPDRMGDLLKAAALRYRVFSDLLDP